ncbi:FtsQ-type POTRA domain-containing protein [Microbacterium sp. ASV49]|uniref:FtsQ-type POTRA domain-containing protein n=1 Tax=Microbacterium candidum TaxID=3041922 RepID=A0ABT7N3Y8_9MICO|nr:FtsQ-type POTRA domain-containing protein [Microbacterium sp. ASV49]MDL9981419.1 FtsQ-type POTRA domain-containing protein [Microbacterium sp. ASV49]
MQRPTPLPPQAEKPARGGGSRPPVEPLPGSLAPEAESSALLAPVTPIDAPPPGARVDEQDAAGPTPDEHATDSESVGMRDVWRAARARRKALRAEVRRFTGRQRRRRAIWIGVAASLVLLVLVTLGAAYSPLFAVEQIRVAGTSQLKAVDVQKALASQLGTPLPLVDESAVKAALVRFPLVESYTLEAMPPHELIVRIVERTPVGAIQSDAGYTVVDAAGVALSTTTTPPAGQPLITVPNVHSSAFDSLGQVMRALPAAIRSQVTAATATTPDDVTFTLGGTRTQVVWGSADQSALKALVLERAMKAKAPGSVSAYDVSSAGAVVFR